jgi:hypothetical protein
MITLISGSRLPTTKRSTRSSMNASIWSAFVGELVGRGGARRHW